MKLTVDKSLCIGCGNCINDCPECFEWGEDGKSQVRPGCDTGKCDLKSIAANCPVLAINVE